MKKIILLMCLLLFVFACTGSQGKTQSLLTGAVVQEIVPPVQDSVIAQEQTGELKEFYVEAFNWGFKPKTIEVNQGDRVKITAKSDDVDHGLAISAYGINIKLTPGKEETVEFIADKKGTFPFYCSVFCGQGHREMTGTLVVK
ncbi:cupredoxin domain-containing protein [Candidatus Woesearchaeota archaeon]|nr:cupredoxin domain-containing protein [Candidatus Woesearchaeota archaeon]